MTITLPSLAWLDRGAAEQATERDTDKAADVQDPPKLDYRWPIDRLRRKGQIDEDYFLNGILHGAAMRYYHDHHFDHGRACENQRERLASFRAATAAPGDRYQATVFAIVVESRALQAIGERLGYSNRSAAVAGALERLNQGLRKLATHYGLLLAA